MAQLEENGMDIRLGRYSPWIQKLDGLVKGSIGGSPGCHVDKVHMVNSIQMDALYVEKLVLTKVTAGKTYWTISHKQSRCS